MSIKKATYDNLIYYTNDDAFIWHINNGKSEPYPRELNIVKNYLNLFPSCNSIMIDVGGHIGTTAIPYSKLFKNVLAFEPNKESYQYFIENIKANNIDNIVLENKGVYNKNTYCKVVQHNDVNSGCFYIKECEEEEIDSIKVIKLDDIDITDNVDFIKIDTEGSEIYVLEGAIELIRKYKPLIQVETNECSNKYFGYNKEIIYEFMKQNEYEIFDDDGSNPLFYCK